MAERVKDKNPGLIQTLSSLQFGVVLLTAIAVVSIIGTLIPQGRELEFYREQYPLLSTLIYLFRFDRTYSSPLFMGLLGLLGLNLVMCSIIKFPRLLQATFKPDRTPSASAVQAMPISLTVDRCSLEDVQKAFSGKGFNLRPQDEQHLYGEKGRFGRLGATVVHISLLFLLAGGMVTLLTGLRGQIVLETGQAAATARLADGSDIPLGFVIQLDRFDVEFYESHPGRPKSFLSAVTVTPDGGESFPRDIRVNHPLDLNGFTVYQSSYGVAKPQAPVSSANDSATVAITLKGMPDDMPPLTTVTLAAGDNISVPGFGDSLSVRVDEVLRDFRRGGMQGGNANPAVRMSVLVHGEQRWQVFAFRNFPGLNMPMHQDLDLLFNMKDITIDENIPVETGPGEFYTVLGVSRDRGIPIVWAGALLMMVGLVLSFYIRPRRVCVVEDNGSVIIGASGKGDISSFRVFVENTVKTLR